LLEKADPDGDGDYDIALEKHKDTIDQAKIDRIINLISFGSAIGNDWRASWLDFQRFPGSSVGTS